VARLKQRAISFSELEWREIEAAGDANRVSKSSNAEIGMA
jgi:hypothetical protein